MFNSTNSILYEIQELVEMHDLSMIDAVVHYAEKSGLEIEYLAEILKKNDAIKFQIELEAEGLHYLKKTNRLPV